MTTTAHVILAVISLAQQLSSTNSHLRQRETSTNSAVALLAPFTPGVARAIEAVNAGPVENDPATVSEDVPFWMTVRPWSRQVAGALTRAVQIAHQNGQPQVGTSHVVLAILEDPESAGLHLIRTLGGYTDALRGQLQQRLQ